MNKKVYIVGGANGAGKTTFSQDFLAKEKIEFLNADEIAKQLSPDNVQAAQVTASRILLGRMAQIIKEGKSFLLETTLSGTSYIRTIKELKSKGYNVCLFYFFLDNPEVSISRIKVRVKEGGHYVADDDVRRRYQRSLFNFWYKYRNEVDQWILSYNGGRMHIPVAESVHGNMCILNQGLFNTFSKNCQKIKKCISEKTPSKTKLFPKMIQKERG